MVYSEHPIRTIIVQERQKQAAQASERERGGKSWLYNDKAYSEPKKGLFRAFGPYLALLRQGRGWSGACPSCTHVDVLL